MTVNDDVALVERRLVLGELRCPACGGGLSGWGWARRRWLREETSRRVVRPRRARCAGCGGTHVLLPTGMLAHRADSVEVVGKALVAKASGRGVRPIAADVGRALGTVRGWLRRFAVKAELLRRWFIGVLVAVAADPVVPDAATTMFADAVNAITAASEAIVGRFAILAVTRWQVAVAASHGRLLSPHWPTDWPTEPINTSSPWLALA